MKIAFYQMRPFDEQAYIEQFSKEFGIDYVMIPGAPCPENLDKAAGCDAVSQNPCEILPAYVEAWAKMGVKYLLCRSIGYDHLPLETAKKLGIRVAHSHYPPEGVANYAIMLMLMCTRKMNQTMLRAAAQDYTLPGKMGRDLSNCTVGIVGTGKIGRTVIAHLQGFGCKILAYDLYRSDEVAKMAEYVSLDELYARSDVISLHTNATAENHHLINADSLARMKDGVLIVNTARGALIDILANYQGFRKCRVIVVFDAYKVKGNPGSVRTVHGVKVVYTKEAETADTYIERATYELRRERRVRVATSDGPEQVIILGHGALRVSARAFHAEVEAAEGQISAVLQRLTNRPRSERTIRSNVKLKQ